MGNFPNPEFWGKKRIPGNRALETHRDREGQKSLSQQWAKEEQPGPWGIRLVGWGRSVAEGLHPFLLPEVAWP